jgi:hypothetical protein
MKLNNTGLYGTAMFREWQRRKITQNSIEVDAETKESTRKTEDKLGGSYKVGHERRKLK